MERPRAQLQDSGAPEAFSEKRSDNDGGPQEKPARGAAPPLLPLYAVERFLEECVGQNQVREGTRRFRRAVGGVMLCLEEETEGRGFQDKEEKSGRVCVEKTTG